MNGVNTKNLSGLASHFNGRKQYMKINEYAETVTKDIKSVAPQGSIIGSLLFLLYINDPLNSSNVFVPIVFADNTNLFFEHSNIKTLFRTVNDEMIKINQWFPANKLSLNEEKTKFSLFHKSGKKHSIPFYLPNLKLNKSDIKRATTMAFLNILLDENLSWKEHIK